MRLLDISQINAAKTAPFIGIQNTVNNRLQAELEKFDDQTISKKTFLKRAKSILTSGYKTAYLKGSGLSSLDQHGKDWITAFSEKQFPYLESFAEDIDASEGMMDYDTRAEMYAKAVQSAYWSGSAAEAPEGVKMAWITTANESCEDCLELESGGPYSPDELPTTPGAGDTKCLSRCRCYLVQVGE